MSLRGALKRILPAPVFHLVRDAPYALRDLIDGAPQDPRLPPLRHQFDGPRGYDVFARNGQEALAFYQRVVGISPDCKMLDIGSGVGRKTLPLLDVLGPDALYVGIDIDERGVRWCSRKITPLNPRFVFFRLDIANKFYNPAGGMQPSELVLPFAQNSFDLVVLWSVFTHMYPVDIARYLQEIGRVLKPGGRIAASYYVMNEHARGELQSRRARENIVHHLAQAGCWTNNPNIPEDLIAVDEDWLRAAHASAGLSLEGPIRYGAWSNHEVAPEFAALNWQDIVVAQKA
ncbi:MAG TPA: methyltransferase domain-containing protein [Nevskiaceae bacterium]|nr:methyltransferase domain-containing protein [Nevskiaceae bacterium]